MENNQPVLQVYNLSKSFGSRTPVWAVKNISFNVQSGEILGLLGPNGAGKTTTIRMLISVLKPTDGSIKIFGKELKDHRTECLQRMAFASTYTNLPLFLTVEENLDIHGRMYGMSAADRKARLEELLKYFGVLEYRNGRLGQLSAGQRTRVMLAKAFMPRPAFVLLDEPTASLDPEVALEVRSFVIEQRRQYNTTILFSSHNMQEVSSLCDRVVFMKDGSIVAIDEPKVLAATAAESVIDLEISSGMAQAIEVLLRRSIRHQQNEKRLEVYVSDGQEAPILTELIRNGMELQHISIHKPTLEDFFLKLSKSEAEVAL